MEEMHPEKEARNCSAEKNLFEDIRDDLQCMYISDITRLENPSELTHSVEKIEAEKYPAKQWKDLVIYVLHWVKRIIK